MHYTANAARDIHCDKLIRLVKFMVWALDNSGSSKGSYTGWYKKAFSGLSERTMKRDVQELEKIGINICYEYLEEFDTDTNAVAGKDNVMNNVIYEHSPNCYFFDLCEFQSIIQFDCW